MPYIPLEEHLPGITGLLEYRKDTAEPIRELTQQLLRGASSLTEGERELIATIVSHDNECQFCSTAHAAVVDEFYPQCEMSRQVRTDPQTAPVSDKMKALLELARLVARGGKHVSEGAIKTARKAGATDLEIHDTVLIAALFCFYNRYVDGLNTQLPDTQEYFSGLASRLATRGYVRIPEAYKQLKEQHT